MGSIEGKQPASKAHEYVRPRGLHRRRPRRWTQGAQGRWKSHAVWISWTTWGRGGGRNILVGFIVRPSLMKCHNRSVKHDASNRTINRLEVDGFTYSMESDVPYGVYQHVLLNTIKVPLRCHLG